MASFPYMYNVNSTKAFEETMRMYFQTDCSTRNLLTARQCLPHANESSRASRLHTNPCTVMQAAAAFPPPEVANFLLEMFFEYAQTNYYYMDEQSLRSKLDGFLL